MAVLNAAPFGGGILAGATSSQGYFAYREAGDETLKRIAHLQATAAKYDVPLAQSRSSGVIGAVTVRTSACPGPA